MRVVVNILVALLSGMALLLASSMRLSVPAEPGADLHPHKDLEALPTPMQHVPDESHALVSRLSSWLNTAAPNLEAVYCTGN